MAGDYVGIGLMIFFGVAIVLKLILLADMALFKRYEIPKDLSGPVSGWGTADVDNLEGISGHSRDERPV